MCCSDAVRDRLGPGALHLGRRLVRLEERGDRAVAVFEGGERVDADMVVAADGIHSAARAARYPDEGPLKWNGSLLWRGVAEIDRVLDGRTMVWAGHPEQKFVGYPIADLPDGRQAFNFIAELRRPGSDLAAWEDWSRAGIARRLPARLRRLALRMARRPRHRPAAPETFLFPMVDRDPVPRWTFGRSTLLGDAAHPMYPIGSNGASQAILDATGAGRLRAAHSATTSTMALARYEAVRGPATAAVVEANRGFGPELPMLLVEQRAPRRLRRTSPS